MSEIRKTIFERMRYHHLEENHVWDFSKYNKLYNDLTPPQKKAFDAEQKKLCEEGLLIAETDDLPIRYRITKLGEEAIWKED